VARWWLLNAFDFPEAVTQGFDLTDARQALPTPNPDAATDADVIELVPLSVHVGAPRGWRNVS
jgi:hypothetical protein